MSSTATAGFQLDHYQLLTPIGVGTVGTIYSAVDLDLPAGEPAVPLAVKVLHEAIMDDPLIRARFKREIMLLGEMQHPNIIASHGGGEADGKLFFVMERVDGGSVGDLIKARGTLPWPAVVSVIRQTCSALQCAHNHGIVHRDLKPSNLFLTLDGEVKLGDFGIARDLKSADLSTMGMTVGTHAYMAPEQITGDRSLSGKADLYSLGCCAFEMLTGKPPFAGENYVQLFEQHLKATPPRVRNWVPECPVELEEIILQMLEKRAEDRPFNARSIQGEMFEIQRDQGEAFYAAAGGSGDAAAASETTDDDPGQLQLARMVMERFGARERRDVSWTKISILLAIIATAIAIGSILSRA